MRILYFDCFSGISGDMTIGALLDLGIDRDLFRKELSKLELEGYELRIQTRVVNGISGTDVNVILTGDIHNNANGHSHEHDDNHAHTHSHEHDDNHAHTHGHERDDNHAHTHSHEHDDNHAHTHSHEHDDGHTHNHSHELDDGHSHTHSHGERGLIEIEQLIDCSSLSDRVKAFSKKVFREIAAAEASVHGKPVNEVHFHEVGAVDSIVDIVGTAICLDMLGVDRICSSALHDGSGFIKCAHGTIPVPVPAVMEMLAGSGIPLISENVGTELVTPTGMGLIKCMAQCFGSRPAMTVERTGYGHGKRDIGRLNALRVILGETYEMLLPNEDDEIAVLETNIDDAPGEILGYTMSCLMDAGALDAFYTPIYMKKNRPAYMLTVIAAKGTEDRLAELVLRETPTLGIRKRYMKRYCMEREVVRVNTPYGEARVKIATLGEIKKASPEYEDCRKIAQNAGLPLGKAYAIVAADAARRYGI